MRIPCPHCGERSIDEFVSLGAADPVRPGPEAGVEAFIEYVYLRDNPAGRHREVFHHMGGCRAILIVERDTRTHDILGVADAGGAWR